MFPLYSGLDLFDEVWADFHSRENVFAIVVEVEERAVGYVVVII